MPIYEGSYLRLCCHLNSSSPNQTVGWLKNTFGRQKQHNLSTTCLYIDKIRRIDSGTYICKGEDQGHRATTNVTLDILCEFILLAIAKIHQYYIQLYKR